MSDPIEGLVQHHPRRLRIFLDSLEVMADIGFHDFEIGHPQRLHVSVEVWVPIERLPPEDEEVHAWNYDRLRRTVVELAAARRYNLQEALVQAIFEAIASMAGVEALRVRSVKPDIYRDAAGVGVEVASFGGPWPE
ncbi:dihydroneopterin aldolase [Sphingomicrobium astaxanthinifaciens]|uniref:dihydroneopterin aldolase n=1 Tax=Sphingomicrobium astaxanthinifaciens TaxID=1227949 RepID=UPI001FCBE104|nr:dihydroneopterin aldolase [Sphingomicrobium astaxanthinifaciens]MCJ7420563.1 dihydroneopterin aldolase [Sphingomicrobium astaxanthinifaciens]